MSAQPVILSPQWVSSERVIAATGWTDRWLRKLASLGKLSFREPGDDRGGRRAREYLVSSLPPEAQTKLQPKQSAPVSASEPLQLTLSLPAPPRVKLADSSDQAKAQHRYSIIEPILIYEQTRGAFRSLRLNDGRAVTSLTRLYTYQAEQFEESERTLFRWVGAFNRHGLAGLADRKRNDKGKSRWFERNPEAKAIVLGTWAEPGRARMSAYEALEDFCSTRGIEPPSYSTVSTFLDSMPAPIAVLAREGERAHNERMAPYVQRDYTSVAANAIWVSDHMIHDVLVRNDCFVGVAENAAMRLRLTALIDMRTRKVVGYSWTPEGSSRSIVTALRRAVMTYGPCQVFYCDNGKDFVKVAKGARLWGRSEEGAESYLDGMRWIERQGVLARLGMQVQHCIKYHPQSKHIERFFCTLHARFDAHSPHYTAGNFDQRPDATSAAAAEHGKLLKVGAGSISRLQPASDFIRMAAHWIELEYNSSPHSGQGMDGRTPNDVFDELYPQADRVTPPLDVLSVLLYEQAKRRVDACAVRLDGRRYVAADVPSSGQLYLANERDVLIHFDPCDPDCAIVTDLDGAHLANVRPEHRTPHSAAANAQIAASMQERKRLRNASAETIRAIKRQSAELGHTSQWQQMKDRALPAGVAEMTTQRAPRKQAAGESVAPPSAIDIGNDILNMIREAKVASR